MLIVNGMILFKKILDIMVNINLINILNKMSKNVWVIIEFVI